MMLETVKPKPVPSSCLLPRMQLDAVMAETSLINQSLAAREQVRPHSQRFWDITLLGMPSCIAEARLLPCTCRLPLSGTYVRATY